VSSSGPACGNKKERAVSDPLLIVACEPNQSFDRHIGQVGGKFKQAGRPAGAPCRCLPLPAALL